jgi:hypothetical protein
VRLSNDGSSSNDDGVEYYSAQDADTQGAAVEPPAAFELPADGPAVLYSGYAPFAITDVNGLWLQVGNGWQSQFYAPLCIALVYLHTKQAGGYICMEMTLPSLVKVCGFSRDEVIGKTMRIIQGPETERDLVNSLMDHVRRRQPFSTVLTNYTKTRQPFRHELRVVPLDTADGLNGPHFLARSRIAVHVDAGMEFASRDPSGLSAGWADRGARAHDGPVVAEAGGRRRAGSARRTAGGGTRASVAP